MNDVKLQQFFLAIRWYFRNSSCCDRL